MEVKNDWHNEPRNDAPRRRPECRDCAPDCTRGLVGPNRTFASYVVEGDVVGGLGLVALAEHSCDFATLHIVDGSTFTYEAKAEVFVLTNLCYLAPESHAYQETPLWK
jgi:hypothetical protein